MRAAFNSVAGLTLVLRGAPTIRCSWLPGDGRVGFGFRGGLGGLSHGGGK